MQAALVRYRRRRARADGGSRSGDRVETVGVSEADRDGFEGERPSPWNLELRHNGFLERTKTAMEGSIRKRAGAVGDAEVLERVGEPEGAHEAHRRGRRERDHRRQGRPAVLERRQQPQRLPRAQPGQCVGDITTRISKLRPGSFSSEDVVERYQRVNRAVVSAVAEMHATGTSTRKVQRIVEKLGVSRPSKDLDPLSSLKQRAS